MTLMPENFNDAEDELCQLVCSIVFTVMWRGISGADRRTWKVILYIIPLIHPFCNYRKRGLTIYFVFLGERSSVCLYKYISIRQSAL